MTRILAIDDSPDILDLLELRLRPEGASVERAQSAREGVEKATSDAPDLILLDLELPDASGFDACRTLKNHPLTRDVPVIFLTSDGDVDTKVHGFDLGAVDYVTKPFAASELRARVRAALRTKRYQDLLTARAQTDALTSLRNRAYFDERLVLEVQAALRYEREVGLLLIDLDHFKRANDSYGHPFGDSVLTRVGEVLQGSVRATDVACRYGGEELAVIATETNLEGGLILGERIRGYVESLRFVPKGRPISITASLGVAATELCRDRSQLSPRTLVDAADAALYRAKHSGRNCVVAARAWPESDQDSESKMSTDR